jgi:CheY-like chemotaxis protein
LHREDSNLEFYVEDTGIGIPPELHVTIFERFRQAEERVIKVYGVNGLGLSISKSFIEKLGENIWVKSVQGKGSTFYYIISYITTTISGVHFLEDSKNENQPKSPTILVVEDKEINYLYIEELLLESNIKIIHAKRRREALELFKINPDIDLVLLGIKLPDINGIEVMKKIKAMDSSIKIIDQTAYALIGDMESAIEAGFDDYVTKPIDD